MKATTKKHIPYKRFNARVTQDQLTFIKARAESKNISDAEVFRQIVDTFIKQNNKKK